MGDKTLFQSVPDLHKALSWLMSIWMLAPIWLMLGAMTPLSIGLLIALAIACYHLARGASSRGEALKVWMIPIFFGFFAFCGGFLGHGELNQFGFTGLAFIAPAWLSEILRYKAHSRKITRSGFYFLAQHGLTLLIAVGVFSSDTYQHAFFLPGFFILILVWYFTYPIGFYLFKKDLVHYALRNEHRLHEEEEVGLG